MPIFVLFVGIILVAAGINNKIPTLTGLIKEDFIPSDGAVGFHYWIVAIIAAGALGYIKPLKGFANGFLVLLILVIILAEQKRSGNGGFFAKFSQALEGK